jgi:hypothetical protein
MKNLRRSIIYSLIGMVFVGCNGGNSTNSTPSTTSTCNYGGASKSYSPNGNFTNIMTNCEFNRVYRGGTNNTYPLMYGENPYTAKGDIPYSYYSYDNLQSAYNELFALYPTLAPFNSGDYMKDMRELAAFLANIGQETNGNQAPTFDSQFNLTLAGGLGNGYGLFAVTEGSCAITGNCLRYGTREEYCTTNYATTCTGDPNVSWEPAGKPFCKLAAEYCSTSRKAYPDGSKPENQFFGRGGKQLTYAYNYMYYGSKINPNNKFQLGDNPSLIDKDGKLGWETALAYWAIPYEDIWSTKPSMHDGFFSPTTGRSTEFNSEVGFGKTVNIINGGVECGSSLKYVKMQTLNRINNYIELLFLNYGLMPIDRVEVTRNVNGQTVIDTYTKEQLVHNISTQGVTIRGSSYTVTPGVDAPNLVKYYTRNGVIQQSNYNLVQPEYRDVYNPAKGTYGRYNSQPLIQEYYANINGDKDNILTDITKIMLYYDVNSSYNTGQISEERLDCTGIKNFNEN